MASGSLVGVMHGQHYNRSVQTHKMTSETLQRLRFQQFLLHLTEEQSSSFSNLTCISSLQAPYPTPEY